MKFPKPSPALVLATGIVVPVLIGQAASVYLIKYEKNQVAPTPAPVAVIEAQVEPQATPEVATPSAAPKQAKKVTVTPAPEVK